MNVLMIHQGDGFAGGGQVQMNRLRTGLRGHGVQAEILCASKTREESHVIPRRGRWERLIGKVTHRLGLNDIHCVSSFGITNHEAYRRADILDFHGIHGGFFSYLALPKLTRDKPAVFTFHDQWPLTGHCHASLECERWKTGCGKCPHPDTYPPVRRDGTAWEWKLKRRAYEGSRFTVVTPSRWLADCVGESMLAGVPVEHIPHGIDTDVYVPGDKEACRRILEVPDGKHVLLFAVENMDRPLKGGDLLVKALQGLAPSLRENIVLLLLGNSGNRISELVDMPTIDLGYVRNDVLKAAAFSAADLFLHPTRAEAFGLVILESMACGTPVVSFRVGAVPELVRPGTTGALAERDDAVGFRAAIEELLEDPALRQKMSANCRSIAVAEYSLDLQVNRYLKLYRSLCESGDP